MKNLSLPSPHLSPTRPLFELVQKAALLKQNQQISGPVPDCPPLFLKEKYIRKKDRKESSIECIEITNGKKGGTPGDGGTQIDAIIEKFPFTQLPQCLKLVRSLLRACGLPETIGGISDLENRYRAHRLNLWDVIGSWMFDPIITVKPILKSDIFFIGTNGELIHPERVLK